MKKRLKQQANWKRRNLWFYILLMAFPVIQFCIFYIGVNGRSILMAFQEIKQVGDTTEIRWTMDNIQEAFRRMTTMPQMLSILSVSLVTYLLTQGIGIPLALFFSYYIYKKLPAHGFFRVILFVPSIISSIVLATIYMNFVERAVPAMYLQFFGMEIKGLMAQDSCYAFLVFYNVLISFGTSVLMYSNAMSGISHDLSGAAQIDGASVFQEFWHVTLPGVFPTLMPFLIAGVATVFTNQFNLFSFYGVNAPAEVQTYGYYLYVEAQKGLQSKSAYPLLSAMGLLMTIVVVPVTLLVKRLLEKYGPRED